MPPTTKTTEHNPGEQPIAFPSPFAGPAASRPTEPVAMAPAPPPEPADLDPTSANTEAMPAIGTAVGDRCAACGSLLANDQRYCLNCGERRGQARFAASPARSSSTVTTVREPRRPGQRISSGTTLIAGVGTLLLAMGIGVLIGRSGNTPAPTNPKVQVVNLGAGSAATTTSGAAAATSGGSSSGSGKAKHGGHHAAKPTSTISAANASTTVKNLPPPTVTVGAKGSGRGYQHGHFTGTFFGP